MSLKTQIAHNTGIQIGGKIISTFLGLIAIGMMTRYLGQEQFGWYTTTISFLGFAGVLIDFGLIPVTAQMMSEPAFDKTKLLHNLLGYRALSAGIFFIIIPFISLLFPYPIPVKIAIAFSAISFFCISINQVFIGFFQQRLVMRYQALGEIVGRMVLVCGLFLAIQKQASFLLIMMIVVIASISYTVSMFYHARKLSPIQWAYDTTIWRAITKKMWPIAIAIMCNVIYLKGDIVILSLFQSQIDVGIYGAAYRVIDIIAQIAMMIMGIMLPLMAYEWSRQNKDIFFKRLQVSFDILMMCGIPMATGVYLLATPLMTLVAGPDFALSGSILAILAYAIVGLFFGSVFGHSVVAINRQKAILWVYISDAILSLIAYLIFIPRYGMYGAAWVTVFSEVYAGIFSYLHVYRYTKYKLKLHTLTKIIIATALMAYFIHYSHALPLILVIILSGLIYTLGLLLTRAVSKETVREILVMKKKHARP